MLEIWLQNDWNMLKGWPIDDCTIISRKMSDYGKIIIRWSLYDCEIIKRKLWPNSKTSSIGSSYDHKYKSQHVHDIIQSADNMTIRNL
jgi:hypothetical protein